MDSPEQASDCPSATAPAGVTAPTIAHARTLQKGDTLDRYVVLHIIGEDRAGCVYAAYDPHLERRVALKLMPGGTLVPDAADARERLLREAKALAKLSHPNVVAVYDAGSHGDDVFLSMELVTGLSLDAWRDHIPHTSRDILRVCAQAGRGLAAAHAAGLVHGDFRPTSIVVSRDGRARVVEFSLTRPQSDADGDTISTTQSSNPDVPHLAQPFHQPPPADGNPRALRHLAPEVLAGRESDERADQFSFCATAWEAVFGEPPYPGDNTAEILLAIDRGRPNPPSGNHDVPKRVRNALTRGLSPNPDDRWPTLAPLLDELERDDHAIRRRWMTITGVFTLGMSCTIALAVLQRNTIECTGGTERLETVWNDTAKASLERSFLATHTRYAEGTLSRVRENLDGYAAAWSATHRQTCEDTHVTQRLSPEILDRRMSCLDQRFRAFRALTEVFADADAKVVENAVHAVGALPKIDVCTQLTADNDRIAAPTDTVQEREVTELRDRLALVEALLLAGRYEAGLKQATLAFEQADVVGYQPLVAEARYVLGDAQARSGDFPAAEKSLADAAFMAEAHLLDELVAKAQIRLVHVIGYEQARFDDGLRWERHASAALERFGAQHDLEADLHNSVGTMYARKQKWQEAEQRFVLALRARESAHGPEHISLAKALSNLAVAVSNQDRVDEAIVHGRRALLLREAGLGPDHPDVAVALNNLALAEARAHRLVQAKDHLQRAIEIMQVALGSEHPNLASAYINLGNIANKLGDGARALASYRQALEIRERAFAPDHQMVANVLADVANALVEQDQLDEAEQKIERALGIVTHGLGTQHPWYAEILRIRARLDAAHGHHAVAIERYRTSLAILSRELGEDHSTLGPLLVQLATSLAARGDHAEAAKTLERVVSNTRFEPLVLAEANFRLARLLHLTGRDRERTRALTKLASDLYAHEGPGFAAQAEEVRRWNARTLERTAPLR